MNNISHKILAIAAAMGMMAISAAAEEYFVKELTFPEGATPEEKVEMASRLRPSDKQINWQNLELTAFLHFGMNTFTDREWGNGNEDPALFNPDALNTDQWVKTLKDAGFKLVILTAKHHDGFCLWPTATTKHSVASSPWLNGEGDVVKMLRKSCDKYGMKMGVYLSPWDRNAECYGDSPRYNDMFVAQLTELLTNYGQIDEVWFDGACGEGPNGKKQEYDWARFKKVIETLQPGAVVAIMGDDVRWVGNEKGQGRETEWSTTAITPGILPNADEQNKKLGLDQLSKDLGSRELVAKADKLYWWPSEVDVSIRPGWFYHKSEQPKSLNELAQIYLNSVGRNSVLLLNIPPDTHGLINGQDVQRLNELHNWIDENFALRRNLKFTRGGDVNCVVLTEKIVSGQRVEDFDILAWKDGKSRKVASGTTIGNKRILTFPTVTGSDSITLNVNKFRGNRHYAEISGLYQITMPSSMDMLANAPRRVSQQDLKLLYSAPRNEDNLLRAIDGDATTSATLPLFQPLTIDLGKMRMVNGFTYMPDPTKEMIFHYRFYTFDQQTHKWVEQPLSGEFSNIVNNPIEQVVYLSAPVQTQYVMLLPIDSANGGKKPAVANFGVIGK